MNNKVDANEVIVNLQQEIADKALQIALLKSQLKDAKKSEGTTDNTTTPEVQGDEQ